MTEISTLVIKKTEVGKFVQFVAEEKGVTAAVLTITVRENEIRMCSLYVVPANRKRKIASYLIDSVLSIFIPQMGQSHKPVYLECDGFEVSVSDIGGGMSDEQLRKFYHRFGFIGVLGHPFAMIRNPVDNSNRLRNN